MERKYKYVLNGSLYFVYLTDAEAERFERMYEVTLISAD